MHTRSGTHFMVYLPLLAILAGLCLLLTPRIHSVWPIAFALAGLAILSAIAVSPNTATLVVLFALYANIPVVAYQYHGLPQSLAGAIVLLLAIPLVGIVVIRREALLIDGTAGRLALFLMVLLVSSIWATSMAVAADYIWTFVLEGLLLYLLLVNVIRDLPLLRKAIWALLLAGLLMGSLSVYQAVTRSYSNQFGGMAQRVLKYDPTGLRYGTAEMKKADRSEGPIGEPNRYGQIMVLLVPLAFVTFRNEKSRKLKAGALVCAAMILGGLVLSYSRGSFLALILILLVSVAIGFIRFRQLAGGLAILVILLLVAAPAYIGRMGSIMGARGLIDEGSSIQPDNATRGRTTEMLAAFLCFADHPVFGVGPGQYSPFYSVQYHKTPEIAFRAIPESRRAHNLYAEMAAETGAVGLLVFLSIPVILLGRLWKLRRRFRIARPDLENLTTGLGLAILAYLATGLFLHLSYQRYFWLIMALSGAAVSILSREPAEPRSEEDWDD